MVMGRDAELERRGVRAVLAVGDYNPPGGVSRTTLYLPDSGDLVLYCTDAGWAVQIQIGEHVREWRRWYTVAAGDVPRLGVASDPDDAGAFLAAVRGALGVGAEQPTTDFERAFTAWLRGQGVTCQTREQEDS
jgi:hypothetical protein